jgi:CheY-like chemotaxis protein
MAIQGNISLIYLDIDKNNPLYKRLKKIEESIQSGVKLTEKLLDFVSDGIYKNDIKDGVPIDKTDLNRIKSELSSRFSATGYSSYDMKTIHGLKTYNEVFTGIKTILLADDDETIIDVGKQMIERMGINVIVARNGQETVDSYIKNYKKINMVILDMIMPDFDGIETYYKLKEINPGVKVLFSSGYRITEKIERILIPGHTGYIQKPFAMSFLEQEISKIIGDF